MSAVLELPTTEVASCPLNAKQIEILQWVANGKRNEEIAELVKVKRPQNVQAQLQRIMDATGTNSRAAAVAYALRRGLIA